MKQKVLLEDARQFHLFFDLLGGDKKHKMEVHTQIELIHDKYLQADRAEGGKGFPEGRTCNKIIDKKIQ